MNGNGNGHFGPDFQADPFAATNGHAVGKDQAAGISTKQLEFIRACDMRPQLDSPALIKGVINREQISLLYGARGCGKTFLALDRDISIATGIPWFGHKVRSGPVVYLAIEAGRRIIQNRVYAWLQAHDLAGADIPFAAITTPVDLCHMQVGDVPLLIATIQQQIGFDQPALLDIDTVSRALAGGDENAPDDMGSFIYVQDQLRSALHCHISGIHHTGKTEGKGARGHSLLPSAVDTELEIGRLGDSRISSVTIARQRDGIAGGKFHFELPQVVLGVDDDSDEVTSCTIKPVEMPDDGGKAGSQVRLSGQDKIALTQLGNAIAIAGTVPPQASNHMPADCRGIVSELWREYAINGGISISDDPKSQHRAFRRSSRNLIGAGLVGCWQNWVWLP